ncbi:MAG: PDZ domain-containing protein [Deltaproteobacteria bacterium]|nr:PDZ domain-containing protein [Deltaproteobacteria bacterium]
MTTLLWCCLSMVAADDGAAERAVAEHRRAEGEARQLAVETETRLQVLDAERALARLEAAALAPQIQAWRQAADNAGRELERAAKNGSGGIGGLEVKAVDTQVARVMGLPAGTGVYVTKVQAQSAAERLGFVAGDVIVAVGGVAVGATPPLAGVIEKAPAGAAIELVRAGARRSIELGAASGRVESLRVGAARLAGKARAAEAEVAEAKRRLGELESEIKLLDLRLAVLRGTRGRKVGIGVRDLDGAAAAALDLAGGAVLVTRADPGSAAAGAGLKVGDVVLRLSGAPVTSAQALVAAIAKSLPNERLALEVQRQGKRLEIWIGAAPDLRVSQEGGGSTPPTSAVGAPAVSRSRGPCGAGPGSSPGCNRRAPAGRRRS